MKALTVEKVEPDALTEIGLLRRAKVDLEQRVKNQAQVIHEQKQEIATMAQIIALLNAGQTRTRGR